MTRRSILALAGASLLVLAACGQDNPPLGAAAGAGVAATSTQAATTTRPAPTVASTVSVPPTSLDPVDTTAATTTTVAETTTLAPTTVPLVLPTAAPPPPANAKEPVIEVGSIEIPKIGVSKSMFEGVSLGVLDHGPGHWPGTAGPGQVGNMVIAGHRMSHDHPFRDIDQLVPGDEVFVTDTAGARFTYTVTSSEIVTPDAMWVLDPTPTATATLFACHPKGSTRQRIIVHLELASA